MTPETKEILTQVIDKGLTDYEDLVIKDIEDAIEKDDIPFIVNGDDKYVSLQYLRVLIGGERYFVMPTGSTDVCMLPACGCNGDSHP